MSQKTEYVPLAIDVIAVACEGAVGDWAAYVKAVPGNNHEKEWEQVAQYGAKLRKEVAEAIFPNWKGLRWRY